MFYDGELREDAHASVVCSNAAQRGKHSQHSVRKSPCTWRVTGWMSYAGWGKRTIDLVGASLILASVLPLMLLLVALVGLKEGRPIYEHVRVGRGGRKFRLLKFRTMVVDAEARLKFILASCPRASAEWRTGRKLTDDPRVTAVGRFLRANSFDELPQLLNVIRGEMSLVGPRPVTEEEVRMYGAHAPLYCSVRPGLTGLWQVTGRNETTYAERIALDADYVRSISLTGDLRILLMTISAVIGKTGR